MLPSTDTTTGESQSVALRHALSRGSNNLMLRKLILLMLMSAVWLVAAALYGGESDTIPAGTKLDIRLKTKLTTKTNRSGDLFTGEILHPVLSGDVEIVHAGEAVYGHIEELRRAGRNHGATMRLVIDTIAARSGMVYKLTPEIQLLTSARDAQLGSGGRGAQGAVPEPRSPQGADLPPGGASVLRVVRYKDAILNPGAELTFLLKQSVAATKASTTK